MISRNPPGNHSEEPTPPRTHVVPLGAAAVVTQPVYDAPLTLPISQAADRASARRRAPRRSLIVVIPEGSTIYPEVLAEEIPEASDTNVDLIVVCAGQPANLPALQRTLRHAQLMLAPAGTSVEALRVLALAEASGDIVTLVSGAAKDPAALADRGLARS